jgi:two-component system response regulator HydG
MGDAHVLVVDDKLPMAETLADGLIDHGFRATALGSAREAIAALGEGGVDVLVTDLRMPDLDGLALLDAARAAAPDVPVIVMTAYGAIDSAVESIRKGAYHYLTKPFKLDELIVFVERALAERALRREAAALRVTLKDRHSLAGLVGRSAAMQRVLAIVERVARSDAPVLLTGETGAGKGAVARALHGESGRRGALVAVNCSALPEQLLESELFGHVRGAFTGATADRPGLFAEADHGTLLLDEIAEMSPQLQAKLLRVLESRVVRPIGASREREVDVRVIAATHRDLRRRVAEGTFREDLLYRLDVVSIEIPPLRHRRDDLPPLVEVFLADARRRQPSSTVTGFARDALARLLDYGWPGNVRELAHVVERCVLLATGPEVRAEELQDHVRAAPPELGATFAGDVMPIRELQRRYARWALDRLAGHKARTAGELGVDVKTLNRWLADDDEKA